MKTNTKTLSPFTRAYLETALWSSNDEDDTPLDSAHDISDIADETFSRMAEDCADFEKSLGSLIVGNEVQAGHDFWLTRNGHGAGFWDSAVWKETYVPEGEPPMIPKYLTVGDFLTAMSKPYGSFDLYLGDDGQIHGS